METFLTSLLHTGQPHLNPGQAKAEDWVQEALSQPTSKVEEILNISLASDLETLQDIVYLLQNEYVLITQ